MTSDDPEGLNLRAVLALEGASLNWRADLAALFKSPVPIDRGSREAFADAIENETDDGPRIDIRNLKRTRDHFAAVVARQEWMEIGRWVQARRDEGSTAEDALWNASQNFAASEGKCKQALSYFQKASPAVERAILTPAGASIGRQFLENIFHQIHADPKDTSFARLNSGLIFELGLLD